MASKPEVEDDTVITSKEIATIKPSVTAVVIGGKSFEIAQDINVPILKQEEGETVVFQVQDRIREKVNYKDVAVTIEGERKIVKQENVINVVRVIEASSKQQFDYVLGAIAVGKIHDAFQDHSYVGKWLAIKKLPVVAGKRYRDIQIVELTPTDMEAA